MRIDSARIINDLIDRSRRQYSIPVYQRNYEWSHEQCVKLFKDIINAFKTDRNHFCGSIVIAPLKEEHHFQYYVVIDGQQRLTTIYLLLKALIDKTEDEVSKESLEKAVFNNDKFDEYKIDDASKLKLKPIKTDNQQLLLLMDGNIDKIDKTCGIWHNYELFSSLIEAELENGLTTKDIFRGIENLTCAQIELDSRDNAQEIFERINSTGIPLSLADKIRNYVLMTDEKQEYLFENYWLKIEQGVGKEYINSFFTDFINAKIDGFTKDSIAYEDFKAVFDMGYPKEDMLKEILKYSDYYHTFIYGNQKYGKTVNSILASMQKLKQTTSFLFLFNLFDDYENNVISLKDLEDVLQFLLNYSIRRMICEVPSNSLRGLFKTLYSRVFICEENKNHYYDSIISFFKQLNTKDAIPTDEKFLAALRENNLYRKLALCKFLLGSLENQGKEKVETINLTIEHIMPQNPALSTNWQKMLGENWKGVQERYLHTLGNLTLTGYNSEMGDRPLSEKQNIISTTSSKVVFLNTDVSNADTWNEQTILNRANRLSKSVLDLYKIKEPATLVTFRDSRYSEYSCEDPSNATNKSPNYYILQGELVNVSTYADMLKSVVEKLYLLDKSIIDNMARTNEMPLEWSKKVQFSYNKNVVSDDSKGGYRIKNTDIYVEYRFSAYQIIATIKALLEKYEIDMNDFIYSAKPKGKLQSTN